MIETQGEIEHTSKGSSSFSYLDSKNFNNMKLGTLLKTPGAKTYELLCFVIYIEIKIFYNCIFNRASLIYKVS